MRRSGSPAIAAIPSQTPRIFPAGLPSGIAGFAEEMRAEAMAHMVEHGHDSPVGAWLWRMAGIVADLDETPAAKVVAFPTQRRRSA